MGNITQSSLKEIWHGERARRLRAAVDGGDLSLGCNFCRWQADNGSDEALFARTFDHLSHGGDHPEWPQQLELSLSNACNLQCVMCNGEWSSSIRTHREKLPPLPVVYDDRFFADLAEFLPHLKVVKFLGGEPFLGGESLRVMEMLAELGADIPVHITTNGTQWSPRIERILDRLNVYVVVSLDGATANTYESIRVGASFQNVVRNIDRFVSYSSDRGTSFSLSHCLMTSNWREFAEFLSFAETRNCGVWVNTVTEPYDASLYHLTPADLRVVVEHLEDSDSAVSSSLSGRRLQLWAEQLRRLRRHLDLLVAHTPPDYIAKRRKLNFSWLAPPERAKAANDALDRVIAGSQGWSIELSGEGVVVSMDSIGVPAGQAGAIVDSLVAVGEALPSGFDDPDFPDDGSVVGEDSWSYPIQLPRPGGDTIDLGVTRVAVRNRDGVVVGARYWVSGPPEDAHDRAMGLAERREDVVGLLLDPDSTITGVVEPNGTVFGAQVDDVIGCSVDELAGRLAGGIGSPDEPSEHLETIGRVTHYRSSLRSPDGSLTFVHAFSEPRTGGGSTLWLVRMTSN